MFTCSSCHFFFMVTVSLLYSSSPSIFYYICSRFKSNSNISLWFFICTDTVWSTLEESWLGRGLLRTTFLFWCGAATTFPVFEVLVLVFFISSPSSSFSGSDDTWCFLILSLTTLVLMKKMQKSCYLVLTEVCCFTFRIALISWIFTKIIHAGHWLMQLLVQYLHWFLKILD